MASIPGLCPHCGCIFEGTGGIHLENSFNITVAGCQITCPNCGEMANLAEGTFNERGDGLELVSGPPLTRAIIAQLQEIARRAQAKELTPKEAAEEAAKIDPRLGSLFERFLALGMAAFAAFFTFLSYQLQQAQFDLQKDDSEASAQFYEQALGLLERQIKALEDEKNDERVKAKRQTPAAEEPPNKPAAAKRPSQRRAQVNKARRDALKERRRMFPRPSRRNS